VIVLEKFALSIYMIQLFCSMYFCTDKSTKSSRQELLARTPLHRLIITKGLRSIDTH